MLVPVAELLPGSSTHQPEGIGKRLHPGVGEDLLHADSKIRIFNEDLIKQILLIDGRRVGQAARVVAWIKSKQLACAIAASLVSDSAKVRQQLTRAPIAHLAARGYGREASVGGESRKDLWHSFFGVWPCSDQSAKRDGQHLRQPCQPPLACTASDKAGWRERDAGYRRVPFVPKTKRTDCEGEALPKHCV